MNIEQLASAIRPRYPELAGKVALITGSSQGIGQGIALRLAREGMHVVIHGKDAPLVDETVAAFHALGMEATGVCTNFSEPDGVTVLFDALRSHHTELHVLVNNAGDLRRTHIHNATTDMLDTQLAVNVRSPYVCSLQAAQMMQAQKQGTIINISSVGGQRAHWRGLPYDVTKGALDAMTRVMSLDLAQDGVRVNAIAPGAIRTFKTPPIEADIVRQIESRIPLGRMGTVLDIAAMVAFLASDDAAYITGQVLPVDGGISAQISPPGQPI